MGQFREELLQTIRASHQYGTFKLSSETEASEYFDLFPALLTPGGLRIAVHEIQTSCKGIHFGVVGCMEMCPVSLIGALLSASFMEPPLRGIVVRKCRKGHGTDNLIEGALTNLDEVLLIEDVTSTGQSVLQAARAIEERGASVVGIVTILNRHEGCDELLRPYDFRWMVSMKEL